jgi:chromosome segregation ATPase
MKNLISLLFVALLFLATQCCDQNCTQCENTKSQLVQQLAICNTDKAAKETQILKLNQQLNDYLIADTLNKEKINVLTQQLEVCNAQNVLNIKIITQLTIQLKESNISDSIKSVQLAQLTQELQASINTTDELTHQLEACNTEKTVKEGQITLLTQQLSSCNNEKTSLNNQIISLTTEITSLNLQLTQCIAHPHDTIEIHDTIFMGEGNIFISGDELKPLDTLKIRMNDTTEFWIWTNGSKIIK